MIALYTQTLNDYLEDHGEGYLAEIFTNYPEFSFNDVEISFDKIFKTRFGFEEIGFETPERFDVELRRKALTVFVDLAVVLDAYLENIDKLLDRSVEDDDVTTTYDYINPMNAEAVDDGDGRLAGAQKAKYKKRYFVNSLTPAQQVKDISDLYHIYGDAVEQFAVLFMGVH